MKIFLDKKECKKSADFRMKVSEKCQKISHGGHSMYGTLSYAEIETPVVDYYVFLGLLALIFAGVWAMVRFMGSKKAEGRGKYQPVMI